MHQGPWGHEGNEIVDLPAKAGIALSLEGPGPCLPLAAGVVKSMSLICAVKGWAQSCNRSVAYRQAKLWFCKPRN